MKPLRARLSVRRSLPTSRPGAKARVVFTAAETAPNPGPPNCGAIPRLCPSPTAISDVDSFPAAAKTPNVCKGLKTADQQRAAFVRRICKTLARLPRHQKNSAARRRQPRQFHRVSSANFPQFVAPFSEALTRVLPNFDDFSVQALQIGLRDLAVERRKRVWQQDFAAFRNRQRHNQALRPKRSRHRTNWRSPFPFASTGITAFGIHK